MRMLPVENADTSGILFHLLNKRMAMSRSDASFDPNRFRLGPGPAGGRGARRRRPGAGARPFIAGPIDVAWLRQARALGVTPLWVGLGLWHLRGLRRADTVVASNQAFGAWGVGPDAKSRALRALERAGLVAVERRGKRSPKVTIVSVSDGDGTPMGADQ